MDIHSQKEQPYWVISGMLADSRFTPTIYSCGHRGIMHDEKYFSQPSEFLPERFLEASKSQGGGPTGLLEPQNYIFGFGRRYVYGRSLEMLHLGIMSRRY
jgi:cytochrome P450